MKIGGINVNISEINYFKAYPEFYCDPDNYLIHFYFKNNDHVWTRCKKSEVNSLEALKI
jgi:hypothetical protein